MRFLLVLACLALASCGSAGQEGSASIAAEDVPDPSLVSGSVEAAFREYLGKRVVDSTIPRFTLSVRRSDGQKLEIGGAAGYRLVFEATITLPNGFKPECVYETCFATAGLRPTAGKTILAYRGDAQLTKADQSWALNVLNINFDSPASETVGPRLPPPCKKFGDEQRFRELHPSLKGDLVINYVDVHRDDKVFWNSSPVTLAALRQYFDAANDMNPVPFEILRVEAGASDATVERVRDLSRQAGLCPYSK